MNYFNTYRAAKDYAQAQADKLKVAHGIEILPDFSGKPGCLMKYKVFLLPKPKYRQGHELRCECVNPTTIDPRWYDGE